MSLQTLLSLKTFSCCNKYAKKMKTNSLTLSNIQGLYSYWFHKCHHFLSEFVWIKNPVRPTLPLVDLLFVSFCLVSALHVMFSSLEIHFIKKNCLSPSYNPYIQPCHHVILPLRYYIIICLLPKVSENGDNWTIYQ